MPAARCWLLSRKGRTIDFRHTQPVTEQVPGTGQMEQVKAIYPGSFDPLTNGHLDLIERGSKIFDELVVAVLKNSEKSPLFTLDERVEMLKSTTKQYSNVTVDTFDGLLVDYVSRQKARVVLRGIRAI